MIFKIHENDLDGLINKIGFSKRTFAEWGEQVKQAATESEGFFNTIKNTVSTMLFVPKQKIELIKEEDFESNFGASAEEFFNNFNLNYNTGSVADLTGFTNQFRDMDETMQSFLQDTMQEQASASYEAYAEYVREANEENQSFAETLKGGLKEGVEALANGLLDAAIGFLIEKGIEALDNLVHKAQYAKEAMEEAFQTISDSQNNLKEYTDTIETNRDRFLELRQGVNKFSGNESLSDEDYAEFLSISQQIAEIAPELVTGYDEQGNALLDLGKNAEETKTILDGILETQQELANATLAENMDAIAKGIKYSVQDAKSEIDNLQSEIDNVNNIQKSTNMNILDALEKDAGLVFDGDSYNKYGAKMEEALKEARIEFSVSSDVNSKTLMLQGGFTKEQVQKAQEYYDFVTAIQANAYNAEEAALKKDLAEKEKLIDEYYSKMTSTLQAWVKGNFSYQALDSTNQKFVDKLIPSLDWDDIIKESGKESFSAQDYQDYIENKIIAPLATIPTDYKQEAAKAISKLLEFKDGDLEIVSFAKDLQREFDNKDIDIDITPIFSDEKEAYNKLQNSLKKIATVSGKDAKESIESELEELGKGGTVNLTLRPKVDTSVLNEKGWDAGEGTATVFSSTYSNEDGTKAINFTPIIADPKTGEAIGVLSPEELTAYAEGVIAGTREDDLNLQIGAVYEGKDAIQQAEKDAMRVHELHEQYFTNDIGKTTKNNVLNLLKDFTKGFSEEEANRWEKVTLGSKSYSEATAKWLATLQTDYSSSIEKLDTSITSLTDNQELLNTALAEQAENGTISEETIASLKEKYSDLSKVLEITTNGVIINKDKLAELNGEEKKSIDKNLASTREKLVEQYNANSLAIAGYKMKLEDTGSITDNYKAQLEAMLSVKEADQAKTEEQIAQLDLLGVEYDQLTSKTNKFLKSLSTADEGNIYDSVHSALEQVKEVYDEGDYGKDEFRNFVDYMSFEDLSTAPIEEVKDKYEDAMETAERYFTESNKGLKNFLTDTKKLGMATKDANGNWKLNIESVDDLAKKLGISSDAAQDILNKFKDKGWEINFTTTTDGLVDVEAKLDKLEKKREKLEKKRLKLVDNKESTEEIDKQIDAVQKGIDGINEQIKLSIETDEAKTRIYEIQSQINSLSNTSVNAYVNKEQIEELKAQQKELAKEYNINLDAVLKVDTDKANEDIEETKEKSKEDTTFEIDAHTKAATDKIEEIFNKTYYLNVGVKNVTLENAKKKITNFLNGVTKKSEEKEESSGKTEANGTAITGKAYANGKRGKIAAGYSAKSLVGELGPEMRVRDGKYEVLGENGPEFTDVRPDDIIFNAKQTEEILKKGKVNARGNAYNTGANGGGPSLDSHTTSKKKKDEEEEKKKKSNSTDTTKFQEAIDWCAQTIGKLTSVIDKINAKLSLTNSSLKTQIKNYKELLNKQQSLINGYSKSEAVYKKEYNKALKKLSKSDQKKVKDGTYKIEQFSGKAKSGSTSKAETRYNNIQAALEARDTYLEAQTNTINAKQDFQEYAESLASVRWEDVTEKVEKLNNQISVLDTRMSNVSGYKAKNEVLSEQLKLQKKILTKKENAYENTQSDANSIYKKISSRYKKNMNSDGTIKTKGVTNQTQLKYIKEYNAYVKELAKDEIELAQAQEDYTAAVQEASVARAEYIKTDYDNKISLIDAKANQLDSQISLAEAKGQVASVEFYKQLQNNSNQRKTELEAEKKALQKQLANTRAYTDEWYEIKQAVIEVDEAIADETLNAVENINKQIEAMEKLKEAKNNYLSSAIGTYDWLESLTDTDDYYNEDGSFSDKGKAVAKGKIDKIKLYEQQAKNAQKNIDDLDAMYANNKDDPTYLNKRIELVEEWQNATKSMYDEQQSLHDMYINGLKEESEALQELIDKKMESLKADKAEYDYQKSITEKTKNITDLEKQLAMLEGDNSEEARAKRQKVKVELEEAQQDLEDTQYDKYLERLENSLGDLQDRFDAVIEKLDKQGAIPSMEELSTLVDSNSTSVVSGVNQIIKDAGLNDLLGEKGIGGLNATVSDLLTTPTANITEKITTTNDWLEDIYSAMPSDGSSGNTDTKVSLSEALGTYDSKNKTADTTGKSTLNKYLMSQGYAAMDEEQMVTLKDAILNSKYSAGMDEGLKKTLMDITSADNLKKSKDTNYSSNKDAIMKAYQYNKANEFISKNATKAKYNRDKYGALNKKIYDITGGKVLNDANAIKLASIFNVRDNDSNGDINGEEGKKLVKLLEKAGFANGGIVEAVRKNGDDGLATLKVGEAVLDAEQTSAFIEFVKYLHPLNKMAEAITSPKIPTVDRNVVTTSSSNIENTFEFNLPNVVDSKSLIETIKTDTQVQRTLQNATVGKLNSNTRFGVNRI